MAVAVIFALYIDQVISMSVVAGASSLNVKLGEAHRELKELLNKREQTRDAVKSAQKNMYSAYRKLCAAHGGGYQMAEGSSGTTRVGLDQLEGLVSLRDAYNEKRKVCTVAQAVYQQVDSAFEAARSRFNELKRKSEYPYDRV